MVAVVSDLKVKMQWILLDCTARERERGAWKLREECRLLSVRMVNLNVFCGRSAHFEKSAQSMVRMLMDDNTEWFRVP